MEMTTVGYILLWRRSELGHYDLLNYLKTEESLLPVLKSSNYLVTRRLVILMYVICFLRMKPNCDFGMIKQTQISFTENFIFLWYASVLPFVTWPYHKKINLCHLQLASFSHWKWFVLFGFQSQNLSICR